jgi:hypothetical protein
LILADEFRNPATGWGVGVRRMDGRYVQTLILTIILDLVQGEAKRIDAMLRSGV